MIHKAGIKTLIYIILLGLAAATVYYFVSRTRRAESVYVTLVLNRPPDIVLNVPVIYVPYWLSQSITVGDRDISLLGGTYAKVADKEVFEVPNYGQLVYLVIEANTVKDKSGIHLYRNKPLLVGSVVDLNLTRTRVSGLVTGISDELIPADKVKLRVTLVGSSADNEVYNSIEIGAESVSSKGAVQAKIIDKTLVSSEAGLTVSNFPKSLNNFRITADLSADKVGDNYYFLDLNKIRSNEFISIAFPKFSLISFQIVNFRIL